MDHGSLQRLVQTNFDAQLLSADTADDALQTLKTSAIDLVLVNRVFDRDGDSGLGLIQSLKQDPEFGETPVMLISNFDRFQSEAIELGAEPGFGKNDLQSPDTVQQLAKFLTPRE